MDKIIVGYGEHGITVIDNSFKIVKTQDVEPIGTKRFLDDVEKEDIVTIEFHDIASIDVFIEYFERLKMNMLELEKEKLKSV